MVKLLPFSEYEDSIVGWLMEVPVHWKVQRLWIVLRMRISNLDKHTTDGAIPVRPCSFAKRVIFNC